MIPFVSFSQAAQDRFVFEVLVQPENLLKGRFLDVGCSHPVERSNTYALEKLGWTGWLIDRDQFACNLCEERRSAVVICEDAAKVDWQARCPYPVIEYLSLDVDENTLDALRAILKAGWRFRVITVEHDAYRFGPLPRIAIREALDAAGYRLVCGNVRAATGEEFEDWYVDPKLVPIAQYERFICDGKKWNEILPP